MREKTVLREERTARERERERERDSSRDGWRGSRLGGRGTGATAELIDTKKKDGQRTRSQMGGRGKMSKECRKGGEHWKAKSLAHTYSTNA